MDLEWKTEKRKIKDLKLFDGNPRKMTEKQAEQLLESLKKFNYVELIAVDQNNRVIAGNMRVQALKKLGREDEEIEVRVPSRPLTEEEAREYLLRSNKNVGEWDWDLLANFSEEELKNVGFESEELDKIFILGDDKNDDEVPPIKKKTDIKYGDVFQLGQHRLLCGDATKKEDVERLMDGKKADMVFTDPPYNIGYDYWDYLDNKEAGEYKKWCEQWFRILVKHSPIILITIGQWNMKMWFDIEKPLGIIAWIARNKTSGSKISLFSVWEPILVYAKKIKKFKRNKADVVEGLLVRDEEEFVRDVNEAIEYVKNNCDLVEINNKRQTDVELHKCPKQVRLLKELLLRYSSRHALILDVFGGSGTTLIAAEQLNRTCYMMEIDPIYCQVIIDRWEQFTGQQVIKLN